VEEDYDKIGVPIKSNGLNPTFPWWEKTSLSQAKFHPLSSNNFIRFFITLRKLIGHLQLS
jgi:hypothetical protein